MPPVAWLSPAAISLVVLVLQNCVLVVMTRYSRINVPPEQRYHTSTLVLNQEIVKMVLCIIIFCVENRGLESDLIVATKLNRSENMRVLARLRRAVFQKETIKIAVPAALFTCQNYLLFVGISNLEATTFQVWSQTKLLSAAIFSVFMLGCSLNMMQWLSLFLLTFGVLLSQQSNGEPTTANTSSLAQQSTQQHPLRGIFACVLSSLSSSYAGVYFEKVVKTTSPSLAVRNIHLSLFGIPFAALSMFFLDILPTWSLSPTHETTFDFWRGYDQWLTIALVFVHALGGLLVAVVVRYADNILKGFATGAAVGVSGIMSFIIWGETPSFLFVVGCCIITLSTVVYHKFDKTAS